MTKLKVLTPEQHIEISKEITEYLKNKYPDLVTVRYGNYMGSATEGSYMVAGTKSVSKNVEHIWNQPSLFVGRVMSGGQDFSGKNSFAKIVFDMEAKETGVKQFSHCEIEE